MAGVIARLAYPCTKDFFEAGSLRAWLVEPTGGRVRVAPAAFFSRL
jgi:hypothetical protein